MCPSEFCADGSCCNPINGQCGDCPCSGVVCPGDQECKGGECFHATGGGGAGGTGGAGGNTTGTTTTTGAGTGGGAGDKGGGGLATGGGGFSIRVTDEDRKSVV